MITVERNKVVELTLNAQREYNNPLQDCEVEAEFSGPSGEKLHLRPFWCGGREWRIRFSPHLTGRWTWQTLCRGTDDDGLITPPQDIDCVEYDGANPLHLHGPLKVSDDGRRLQHLDGKPFFWLGDTAWNGVIRGDDGNWQRYLDTRAAQNFSVIQYVSCHWCGDAEDEAGERAFTDTQPIRINPHFFDRLDRRVAMINERGLIAAPVVLWSLLETDVGRTLSEEDAIGLASYIVSRYDAYQVVWLLGGDADYRKIGVERWKRIGRAVFSRGHSRLAGLHPCGQTWVGDDFRSEPWYDIIGYQSGHGDGAEHLRWLAMGPPSQAWDNDPPRPVINMEPNYETAIGYQHRTSFSDYHVRRAASHRSSSEGDGLPFFVRIPER